MRRRAAFIYLLMCILLVGLLPAAPSRSLFAPSTTLAAASSAPAADSSSQTGAFHTIANPSYTLSHYQTWTYTLNTIPYAVRTQTATDVRCFIEVQNQDGTWLIGNGNPWNSRLGCQDLRVFYPTQLVTIRITIDNDESRTWNFTTLIEGYNRVQDQISGVQVKFNGAWRQMYDRTVQIPNYGSAYIHVNAPPSLVRVQCISTPIGKNSIIGAQYDNGTWFLGHQNAWDSPQGCGDLTLLKPLTGDSYADSFTVRVTNNHDETVTWRIVIEGYNTVRDSLSVSKVTTTGAWQTIYDRTIDIYNYGSAYIHINSPPDRVRVQCFSTPIGKNSIIGAQYDNGTWFLGHQNAWDSPQGCGDLTLLKPLTGDSYADSFTVRVTNNHDETVTWRIVIEGYKIVHDATSGSYVTAAQTWQQIYDRTMQIPNYSPAYVHVSPPLDKVRVQCYPIAPTTTTANRLFVTAQSDNLTWLLGTSNPWDSHIDCKSSVEIAPSGGFTEGFTVRVTNDNDATNTWRVTIEGYREQLPGALPPDQNRIAGEGASCPCQQHVAANVNTRTGNYWTSVTDLAVQSAGPELAWVRNYSSQAITDTTNVLGAGWQHPYAARLILPSMPGGESGRVIVLSSKTNKLRFSDLGNGQYSPFPGVSSTLTKNGTVYIQTLRDREQLTFDATTGQLLDISDARGRHLTLTYSGSPSRLTRVEDALNPSRFLSIGYTSAGQIDQISDGTRSVQYDYSNGDLSAVTDVMGRTSTYAYQGHLLTRITNPLGQDVAQITYNSYTAQGKATSQILQDGRQIQFTYGVSTTVMTTTAPSGEQEIQEFTYNSYNTLTGVRVNGQEVRSSQFDNNFNQAATTDANNHTTLRSYTKNGLLLAETDALGHRTGLSYDSSNRLTLVTDPLGGTTQISYDTLNNPLSTSVAGAAPSTLQATQLYTYTYNTAYGSRLLEQRSPDGLVTHFDYSSQQPLQVIRMTVGYGTALAQVTEYGYDALGRVITTTVGVGTALARTDTTSYNADNTVAKTIQNYQNGVFDSAHPDQDVITTYGYDGLGRPVWVRDALGHYDVTHYDAHGWVDWTARNLTPLQLDSQGQPIFQSYSTTAPDANVATLYGYDGLGRTTLVTQTGILAGTFDPVNLRFSQSTTRVTRTEYDDQSRPVTTTLNYRPGLPAGADTNVRLVTAYDPAGNVIWERDALGYKTKTDYDALNRPVKITRNYENGNPLTVDFANQSWTNGSDTDLMTAIQYDPLGRVERQIDNYVNGVFSATEPITDRITLYQYDALGRAVKTIENYDPLTVNLQRDTNRTTALAYHPQTTRLIARSDPSGQWSSQQYDALGRVTTTIQNCRDATLNLAQQGCGVFQPTSSPDRNVPSQMRYDALGRVYETVDPLGSVSHIDYDGLSRPITQTLNYDATGAADADTNVATRQTYDALGRVTASVDALGATTTTTYDGLGNARQIIDPRNRATRLGYDGTGTLRWRKRADGQLTLYQVDGLGRVITTISNYQDGVVGFGEPSDQDLSSSVVYDAGARFRPSPPMGV